LYFYQRLYKHNTTVNKIGSCNAGLIGKEKRYFVARAEGNIPQILIGKAATCDIDNGGSILSWLPVQHPIVIGYNY
jgi:hypothetical protein